MGVNNEKKEVEKYFYLEKKRDLNSTFQHTSNTRLFGRKKKRNTSNTRLFGRKRKGTLPTHVYLGEKKKEHFQHTFIWEEKKKKEVEKLSS